MENPTPLSADSLKRIEETAAKLSEADALLLTRAHFGNPATIKALFQHAHPRAYHLSLTRRLIAAFIATFSITFVTSNLVGLLEHFLAGPISTAASGPYGRVVLSLIWAAEFLGSGMTILIIWKLFARWRRSMAQGRRLWFQTWPLYVLLPLLL